MTIFWYILRPHSLISFLCISLFSWCPVSAQSIAFKQAVAQAAFADPIVFKFYQDQGYQSFWLGDTKAESARFGSLVKAISATAIHGLPDQKFNMEALLSTMLATKTDSGRGSLDVELTIEFLRYARAVHSGVLVPSAVDEEIVRKVAYQNPNRVLEELKTSNAEVFFKNLPPQSSEYALLLKEKQRLEHTVTSGGWGAVVTVPMLKPGSKGAAVIALRNRLLSMGYLQPTFSGTYDAELEKAVREFQTANGLFTTGIANAITIEQINRSAAERLMSVLVAMERERWLNQELGYRHILVNLADFSARIIDGGKVTFQTNSVIGADDDDRRSPEFSDIMEHMIFNPSWYIPRSIITREYLPMLQANPGDVDFLELLDDLGNIVERADVDFGSFDEVSFPYGMRQPPSKSNALGLVKFMFPNKNNIYLHDTPAKKLLNREVRAFSHGCIRLADPFNFAHTLLAVQTPNPELVIQAALELEEEIQIDLLTPVPVHLIYRTAITLPGGGLEFRRDIYGRDAKIWDALQLEGVVLNGDTG